MKGEVVAVGKGRRDNKGDRLEMEVKKGDRVLFGNSGDGRLKAARLADGVFANAPADAFVRQVDWIRDECGRVGRDPADDRAHAAAEGLEARVDAGGPTEPALTGSNSMPVQLVAMGQPVTVVPSHGL